MNNLIGVHLEGGVVLRVTSGGDEMAVVIDDGVPTRALPTVADDGETAAAAAQALESTRCHGIGIACDIAGERLIELGRTKFDDSREYVEEIAKAIDRLADMMAAAVRLQPIQDADFDGGRQ